MKYFYDCEFIDDGITIELISIAIIAEDGREFYAVSTDFDPERAGQWVRINVIPKLPSPASPAWMTREKIRDALHNFFSTDSMIELWAWVGAYDHVALCQLWGSMTQLPSFMPRFTHELKQLWETAGKPVLPAPMNAHDALSDARDNQIRYHKIMQISEVNGSFEVYR